MCLYRELFRVGLLVLLPQVHLLLDKRLEDGEALAGVALGLEGKDGRQRVPPRGRHAVEEAGRGKERVGKQLRLAEQVPVAAEGEADERAQAGAGDDGAALFPAVDGGPGGGVGAPELAVGVVDLVGGGAGHALDVAAGEVLAGDLEVDDVLDDLAVGDEVVQLDVLDEGPEAGQLGGGAVEQVQLRGGQDDDGAAGEGRGQGKGRARGLGEAGVAGVGVAPQPERREGGGAGPAEGPGGDADLGDGAPEGGDGAGLGGVEEEAPEGEDAGGEGQEEEL
jgi:hypothetical protein